MGLKQKSNNLTYVKISDGKFFKSADKEKTEPFDELEGCITGLNFKTENYNGQDIEKLQIILQDEEGNSYALSIPVDSSYMSSFVSFAKNADLSRPITLVPVSKKETNKEGKEVERRSLLIKQDDKWLKNYFSRESGNQLPQFEKKIVNKKTIWDKSDFLTALQEIVESEFVPQIGGKSTLKKVADVDTDTEDADDLPF